MKLIIVLCAAFSLTGCTTPRYKALCPPLVHYTAQEEKQAADELEEHPELHELPVMMRDYGNERWEMKQLSGIFGN